MVASEQTLFSLFQIGNSIQQLNKGTEKSLGLSLVQWCLLRQLVNMPAASAQSLAKAAGIHPSTLTQTLKRLERKQYVFITEDPNDSRRKLISLTRLGNTAMESASLKIKGWSSELIRLRPELARLQDCLTKQMKPLFEVPCV